MTKSDKINPLLYDQKWRLSHLYKIKDKSGNIIPFIPNWAQIQMLDSMHSCNIVLKARQLGITTFCCVYLLDVVLWSILTKQKVQAGIIAHTLADAQDIFQDKLKFIFEHLDPRLRVLFRATGDSARELSFAHGSIIRVGTSLRSATLQYLHISEYGKICAKYPEKAREVATGALNTVQAGQTIIIESTAEGKEGHYHDLVQRARRHEIDNVELSNLDYKFFFFPWWKESEYVLEGRQEIDKHKEYFDKIGRDNGIKLSDAQKRWYAAKAEVLQEDMKREYPSTADEAFEQSQVGNWYAEQMRELRDSGRISNISYDKTKPVHCAFDLGQKDPLAVWFFQLADNGNIHLIDYFERENCPLDQLSQVLNSKGYTYGEHIFPHDANHRDKAGITFMQQAAAFGIHGIVLENHGILDGINLARMTISKCYFDKDKTRKGLECLEHYSKEWSNSVGGYTSQPLHNSYSHGCFIGDTMVSTARGDIFIKDLKVGESVLTPNGYKKIKHVYEYDVRELNHIKFSTTELYCTPNHKIFKRNSLTYADAMGYNDEIYSIKDLELCLKIGYLGREKGLGFRDYFLSETMKSFCTLTGEGGIENMQKNVISGKISRLKRCVSSAVRNIMQKSITSFFVQTDVNKKTGIFRESITKHEDAESATRNLFATNTFLKERVVQNAKLNLQTTQKVYDIEVEDDHCYFANGILVSNSDAFRYLSAGYKKISESGSIEGDYEAARKYFS